MVRVPTAFDLSDAELALLEIRQRILLPLAKQYRPAKAETIAAAEQLGLSYRMVRLLIQRYGAKNDPTVFLARRTGRRNGAKSLTTAVEQMIMAAMVEFYAKPQRPRVELVYRNIRLACSQRGIQAPSLSTVRRRFAEADPEIVARRRHGRSAAQKLKPVTGAARSADYPLHVVQIDHTEADVIIVSSSNRKPIGRPWVTLAIDLYSRCIAGCYVSLEAPSATVVGLCLVNVAQDKEVILAQHQIEARWPLAGKPTVIHTDNGADFTSKALKQGCLTHGIRLEHRPVGQPHYGGTIERVIGTFMGAIHDELPGTTQSNIVERGDYDAEGKACLTLQEFEHWLLQRITEYHATIHRGIGETPLQRLLTGLDSPAFSPSPVKDLKTYLIDFLPVCRRRLRRDGFHLDNIAYYDPKLDYYILRRDKYLDGFELRRDPRNLRFIWMRQVDRPGYMEIPYRRLTNPDVTLWEHHQALKELRDAKSRHIDEQMIMRTVLARRETIRKASLNTKRARRNEERLKHQGPLVGSQHPLPAPAAKSKREKPLEPYEVEVDW